ncbi:uncharacterized protein MCYG_05820 [Microsporum canis CBS 113480]|uniref:Uncharacterized protein n=1 Tax=Arthroderma otae (strain ATCC MYA-4605 / CBS 113480) TaxID=554155 RepID=C5FSZ8_ARTOC|nr:uncharacterized protein MCYG_05820 [Microsporum canis CBS 113480]EEQ33001.1 predicted protein [Microsporum canis CBS 113480]
MGDCVYKQFLQFRWFLEETFERKRGEKESQLGYSREKPDSRGAREHEGVEAEQGRDVGWGESRSVWEYGAFQDAQGYRSAVAGRQDSKQVETSSHPAYGFFTSQALIERGGQEDETMHCLFQLLCSGAGEVRMSKAYLIS